MPEKENQHRTLVVVNPASAAGSTGKRWKDIKEKLCQSIGDFEEFLTERPEQATEITAQALDSGYGMIVAVGGDGTLNEVANGFFKGKTNRQAQAILGFVPHGTGGDFKRSLGISDWKQACSRLGETKTRIIDVGHVEFLAHDGRTIDRVFLNVASFGCGGAVSNAVRESSKRLGGRITFLLTTAKTLFHFRDQNVSVSVDDAPECDLRITNYALCNAQFFGGGIKVGPRASLDDGLFDTTIWSGVGLKDFIFKQAMLFNGDHIHDPRTLVGLARKLKASSLEEVLLDVDGENPGQLPATFSILPSALILKA